MNTENKLILNKEDLSSLIKYFEENQIPKSIIDEMIEVSFLIEDKDC